MLMPQYFAIDAHQFLGQRHGIIKLLLKPEALTKPFHNQSTASVIARQLLCLFQGRIPYALGITILTFCLGFLR